MTEFPERDVMNVSQKSDSISYETFSFRQWLFKVIADPGKNYLLPASWLRWLTRSSRSELIAESYRSPGSWWTMELIYQNHQPVDLLDRMALQDNAISIAARNRRKYVVAELTRLLLKYSDDSTVNVLGVGAGPGLQLQDAASQSGLKSSQLSAVFVDREETAFDYGRSKAGEAGLLESVQYIKGDAREINQLVPDKRFHVVKLIGIIEYLTDSEVIELFSSVREVMHPDGTLLTHGIEDTHNAMPFLERVFGLKHIQRSGQEVVSLLSKAGFGGPSVTQIPFGVYPMVSANPKTASSRKYAEPKAA